VARARHIPRGFKTLAIFGFSVLCAIFLGEQITGQVRVMLAFVCWGLILFVCIWKASDESIEVLHSRLLVLFWVVVAGSLVGMVIAAGLHHWHDLYGWVGLDLFLFGSLITNGLLLAACRYSLRGAATGRSLPEIVLRIIFWWRCFLFGR
jgi:hypothetical protein